MLDAVYYVPHITKIFVLFVLISSLIIRGIIIPLSRNINSSYLFPFNWFKTRPPDTIIIVFWQGRGSRIWGWSELGENL